MKLFRNILFASLLAPFGAYAATVDVWLNPQNQGPLAINDVFTVDIMIGNYIGTGSGAQTGAVTLEYDSNILTLGVAGVDLSTGPGTVGQNTGTSSTNAGVGTIDTIGLSDFFGFTPTPFLLATVEFVAIGNGVSNLLLSNPNDLVFNWVDDMAIDVTPSFTNGSVAVGVVPLPAAAWLMLSGLGACGFLGRRKATTAMA